MDIPIEIYQLILSHSIFLSQIRLRCMCKLFHEKLEVHDFTNCDYTKLLTDDILRNYSSIRKLYATDNTKITNVNYMCQLKILYAGGNCGIDNEGIASVTGLEVLCANFNPKITNVNHLKRLKILYATYVCGIDDNGIANINLERLYASANSKITNVNHMSRLALLYAGSNCGINDEGIANVKLKILYAYNNSKITKHISD